METFEKNFETHSFLAVVMPGLPWNQSGVLELEGHVY